MNKSTVVKVQNISKIYKLYNKPIDRLKESLHPFKKIYYKEFHALDSVSFELKKGEALGVIGRNGNGKSTLLKIISGVLTPTQGHCIVKGKISAILELTSSLKQELTGLENIKLNLKISGFKDSELEKKIKEIEEFAEIGEFIKQPVKIYSSGMKSRLGFGIATSTEPDILILDEVLAVGDFNFRQKCLAKINSMRDDMSIIFVSHSMNDIRMFCDNVMVLEKGKNAFYGKVDDGIKYYLEKEEKKKTELKKREIQKETRAFYGDVFHNKNKIINIEHYWVNKNHIKRSKSKTNDNIGIYIKFELLYTPIDIIIGLPIWDIEGNYITGISTEMDNYKIVKKNDNTYEVYFMFQNIFNPNKYINIISIADKGEILYRQKNDLLEVYNSNSRNFGFINLPHEWKHNSNKEVINFKKYKLVVNDADNGGMLYNSKDSYEEINNKIYKEINDLFSPSIVIDIGANYGFTSLIFSKSFPNAKLLLIEASHNLISYIYKNMKLNFINNFEVINAICAEVNGDFRDFSLNPFGSQDNRVIGENDSWGKNKVKTISINEIINMNTEKFYFLKIDTQGYEPNVFKGGETFLLNNKNWIVKTEFAPYWLKSQGFNPNDFLRYLVKHFIVCEAPNRIRYKGDNIFSLLKNKLVISEVDGFISYIIEHNKEEKGWCDLYIFPKNMRLNNE